MAGSSLSRYVIGAYLEISAFRSISFTEGNNAFLGLSLTALHYHKHFSTTSKAINWSGKNLLCQKFELLSNLFS
jgi:hypothetical protein